MLKSPPYSTTSSKELRCTSKAALPPTPTYQRGPVKQGTPPASTPETSSCSALCNKGLKHHRRHRRHNKPRNKTKRGCLRITTSHSNPFHGDREVHNPRGERQSNRLLPLLSSVDIRGGSDRVYAAEIQAAENTNEQSERTSARIPG